MKQLEGWAFLQEITAKRKQTYDCSICCGDIKKGDKFLSLRCKNTRYGGDTTIMNYHEGCWFFVRDFILSLRRGEVGV